VKLPKGVKVAYSKKPEGWAFLITCGTDIIEDGQSYSEKRADAVACVKQSLEQLGVMDDV
jgi:hypothetical protein